MYKYLVTWTKCCKFLLGIIIYSRHATLYLEATLLVHLFLHSAIDGIGLFEETYKGLLWV